MSGARSVIKAVGDSVGNCVDVRVCVDDAVVGAAVRVDVCVMLAKITPCRPKGTPLGDAVVHCASAESGARVKSRMVKTNSAILR